jgi:hypothetical protein
MTTGVVFGLLTVVHLWRMVVERHLVTDPWYWLVTVLAAGFGLWAFRVLRTAGTPR